eukprot:403373765
MSIRTQSEISQEDQEQINTYNKTYKNEVDMYEEFEANKQQLDSRIFSQHFPIIGKVPMCFFIPPCIQFEELKDLIVKNGGKVLDTSESFSYQIKPDGSKTSFDNFYKGPIYSGRWIIQSVQEKKVLNRDDFFICMNVSPRALSLNLSKKKKYTISEGMKLYEALTNQKNTQNLPKSFWIKAESQNLLLDRSADSMKNFWNKISSKTLEQYLIECIHEKTDYCLSFKEIPNPNFIPRFKQQFENEFMKLEAFDEMSEDGKENDKMEIQQIEKQASSYGISRNIGRSLAQLNPDGQQQPFTPRSRTQSFTKEETKLQDLAAKDILMEETKQQQRPSYQFKKLQKLDQSKLSYNPNEYIANDTVYLSLDKRILSASSFEMELENHLTIRMQKLLPKDFDIVEYDKELLQKQLDLETVEITLTQDAAKAIEFDVDVFYERAVRRFPNEEGMFRRLQMELSEIGQRYGVGDLEVNKMFIEVSCCKAKLIEVLERQSFSKWSELEDLALRRGVDSEEYKYLMRQKGAEEVARRVKFLGI